MVFFMLFQLVVLLCVGIYYSSEIYVGVHVFFVFLIFLIIVLDKNQTRKTEEKRKIEEIENLKRKIWHWCLEHEFVKLESLDDYEKYNIMLKELNVNNVPEIKNILFSVINTEDFQTKIKRQAQQKKKLDWQQYISLAECVYNKCVSLNIDINNDYESIEVVANSFGISNDMLKKMYKYAKKEAEIKNREIIEERLKQQNGSIEYAEKISCLDGKNRYYFREQDVVKHNEIKKKLIDDRDQERLRKLLDIKVLDYEILDTGNIKVNVEINYNKEIKILNQDAIIDGSFLVKIMDVDNNEVAIGYLNGKYLSLKKFGFYRNPYSILCKKVPNSKLGDDCQYNVMINTIKLWVMEK